jgi:myo-inositol-1-phosphate synthase
MKSVDKMSFIVDIIPDNFKVMGIFIMNNKYFMHIGDKRCVLVSFEGNELNYEVV